jgi:hypothetical protein
MMGLRGIIKDNLMIGRVLGCNQVVIKVPVFGGLGLWKNRFQINYPSNTLILKRR